MQLLLKSLKKEEIFNEKDPIQYLHRMVMSRFMPKESVITRLATNVHSTFHFFSFCDMRILTAYMNTIIMTNKGKRSMDEFHWSFE